jgi:methionyl-tRNA formyltransferase
MSNDPPRVIVVGNRNLARHVLVYLLEQDWNVVGAVGATGDAARRQAGFVSFNEIAKSNDIKLIEIPDLNEEENKKSLSELNPDICICPGWHQILERSVLTIPTNGFLGFHSSDLPKGRGGAPINWSIIHGENEITISLFRYTLGIDAGEIVTKETVPVEEHDDVRTVIDRLALAACDALKSARKKIENSLDTVPQSETKATYRPRRQPQDGIIDWNTTANEVRNWIRAQTDPYPGAYTFFEDGKLIIWSANISHTGSTSRKPGTVTNTTGNKINVAVSDGVISLTRVQPKKSPRMWADEFADRHGIAEGDRFSKAYAPSSWLYTGIRDSNGGVDFSDITNLSVDEKVQFQAVAWSAKNRKIRVEARCEGRTLTSETVHTKGEIRTQIGYEPKETGIKTLAIEFYSDNERVDIRYLKLFIH